MNIYILYIYIILIYVIYVITELVCCTDSIMKTIFSNHNSHNKVKNCIVAAHSNEQVLIN